MAEETSTAEPTIDKPRLPWGPISGLVISALAYLVSQLFLIIPFLLISAINHGADIQTILDNSSWLELSLTGFSAAVMLLVLWLFLKARKSGLKDLGFRRPKVSDFGWLVVGAIVYYVLLIIALAIASQIPGFNVNQAQNLGYQSAIGWQLILVFIGLVILPPVAEEMLFRGFLYRGLSSRWPRVISALLASGLFAAAHLQWNVGIDVFILSLVMIALLEKTKNLWTCIGLHMLKNGIAFVTLFVLVGR